MISFSNRVKSFFHGLLFYFFVDFAIYVTRVDQPWVAFLAR